MTPSPTEKSRRWFQFRLGTLLMLTLVAALAVAWWVDRSRLARLAERPHEARVFMLKNAKATAAAEHLNALFASEVVFAAGDARTNAVVVRAPSDDLQLVQVILQQLDE